MNQIIKETNQQNTNMEDKHEYYKCFSPRLKEYLKKQGFTIVHSFVHSETNKICWVYKITDALSYSLTQWTNGEPTK